MCDIAYNASRLGTEAQPAPCFSFFNYCHSVAMGMPPFIPRRKINLTKLKLLNLFTLRTKLWRTDKGSEKAQERKKDEEHKAG